MKHMIRLFHPRNRGGFIIYFLCSNLLLLHKRKRLDRVMKVSHNLTFFFVHVAERKANKNTIVLLPLMSQSESKNTIRQILSPKKWMCLSPRTGTVIDKHTTTVSVYALLNTRWPIKTLIWLKQLHNPLKMVVFGDNTIQMMCSYSVCY